MEVIFMRIAITGVPGTGKTTLTKLIGEYTTLEVIPEIENVVMQEMGFADVIKLRDARGIPGLIDNFFRSLDRKIHEETTRNHFVADKTVFDMGARWFGRMWPDATSKQHDQVREAMVACAHQKRYDMLFYLPLHSERAVHDNSLRTSDFYLRYQRDLLLRGLLSEHNVAYTPYEFSFTDNPLKVISDLRLDAFKR